MTAYSNKTIAEIRDLLFNSFQEKFNKVFRVLPKSFIRIICTVFAAVYITLYKQIGWLFLQLFPETAYWSAVNILGISVRPLVKWGNLIGVGEPRSGSQWKGIITINVTRTGSPLVAGTQFKSDITGMLYITENSITLENETESVQIICAESGIGGNLETGDVLSFVNPLGFAQRTVTASEVIKYGSESETEAEYRARVVSRFRSPPMGGALSDYRRWASDVSGVLNTYPCKDTETPSGVFIYVAGITSIFPARVPTPDLLRQVGSACTYDPETGIANRKPLTAIIDPALNESYTNIKPVEIEYFDIYINGIAGVPTSDFGAAVKVSIENYFLNREPYIRGLSDDNNKTNIVSRNNVTSIIDQSISTIKAEFESVTMKHNGVTTASFTLNIGKLAALNNLYLNGGLYE